MQKYIYGAVVSGILLLSFVARLPNIGRPLLDAHYFRQTQTATVVRNFYTSGIDPFHTKLDIFGSGREQVLLLEFPFFQIITAAASHLTGFYDYTGRVVALALAVSSGLMLAVFVKKLLNKQLTGIIAVAFFLFSPLNYFFQQAYMIESAVIFLHIGSLLLWLEFTKKENFTLLLSASLLTALAFVQKIVYAPFLLFPVLAVLFFRMEKRKFWRFGWLPGILLAVSAALLWQFYVNSQNMQNGHPGYSLSDTGQQLWNFGNIGERFDTGIWQSRFYSIQNNVTKYQWPLFIAGLIIILVKRKKEHNILSAWLFSMIIYYLLLFRIQSHDYYFMPVMPVFNIISAVGLSELTKWVGLKYRKNFIVPKLRTLFIFLFLSLFAYKSALNARMYFRLDTDMIRKLEDYNSVIKKEGNILFVFPEYDWNSVYTYYTHHKGSVIASGEISGKIIEKYRNMGYRYVVIDGAMAVGELEGKWDNTFGYSRKLLSGKEMVILEI